MLLQILITTSAMSTLALLWLFVQRLSYVETPASSGDYLEGRWGCGDCSVTEDCALRTVMDAKKQAST